MWEMHRGDPPDDLIIEFTTGKQTIKIPVDKQTTIHRHKRNGGKPGELIGKFPVWIPPAF